MCSGVGSLAQCPTASWGGVIQRDFANFAPKKECGCFSKPARVPEKSKSTEA